MDTHNFSNINDFCLAAQNAGITTVILCYTDDWGPSPAEGHQVDFGPRQEMLVLAYQKGKMWRCQLRGEAARRQPVQQAVTACGLSWQERSRNTT